MVNLLNLIWIAIQLIVGIGLGLILLGFISAVLKGIVIGIRNSKD